MKGISISWQPKQDYKKESEKMIENEALDLKAKIQAQSLTYEEKKALKSRVCEIINK